MKKLTSLVILSLCLVLQSHAETKTLIVNGSNKTETLTIKEGQVAKVLFWGFSDISIRTENPGRLTIKFSDNEITFRRNSFVINDGAGDPRFSIGNFNPVVTGPAEIKLERLYSDSMLTVKIENDSGVNDNKNVTVIPETADDSTLVLEGSDDMVNWTTETLGDKPKANRKKFYRLRAKKK